MLYVCTYFDQIKYGRPLVTLLFDTTNKKHELIKLYAKQTGKSIYDIEQDISRICEIISRQDKVCINDLKQHHCAFGIPNVINCQIYDSPAAAESSDGKSLVKLLKDMVSQPLDEWMRLRAKASIVYNHLQQKGVIIGFKRQKANWHMDTYSGRSRMTDISLQGLEAGTSISNINLDSHFINFDWVSADIRMASLLSGDGKLIDSFNDGGDPYTYLANEINGDVQDDKLTRDEAKILMFKCIYAMDHTTIVTDIYRGLGRWMIRTANDLLENGYSTSLLGRKFHIDDQRDMKSAFNATIQGSVVHAMHSSLFKIWELYPDNILMENHDSITMTCKKSDDLKHMVGHVVNSMLRPFDHIDFVFPVVVSVGNVYKKWKKVKRYG